MAKEGKIPLVEKFLLVILNDSTNLTSPFFLLQQTKWSLEEKGKFEYHHRSSVLANLLRLIYR